LIDTTLAATAPRAARPVIPASTGGGRGRQQDVRKERDLYTSPLDELVPARPLIL
jgi:hypothetical protein